jgi:hypothetical protein
MLRLAVIEVIFNSHAKRPRTFANRWHSSSRMDVALGHHLQVNGMCAVAQEARELNLMISAEQRRLDYVTDATCARIPRIDALKSFAATVILRGCGLLLRLLVLACSL